MRYDEIGFEGDVAASLNEDLFALCNAGGAACWKGYIGAGESMPRDIYRRIVYDEAILNGIFIDPKDSGLDAVSLKRLGYLNMHHLDRLRYSLNETGRSKFTLFAHDRRGFVESILQCDKNSGILLSLMLDYSLEVRDIYYKNES